MEVIHEQRLGVAAEGDELDCRRVLAFPEDQMSCVRGLLWLWNAESVGPARDRSRTLLGAPSPASPPRVLPVRRPSS